MSTLGTYQIQGTKITGNANKITGFDQFSTDPNEQEGYYLALDIEPWEGAQVRSSRKPERWTSLVDDGTVVIFLGKDAPDQVEWYEVKDANGSIIRYSVEVSAAVASLVSASKASPVIQVCYEDMKKDELISVATERNIELPKNATKAQIIKALEG